MVISYKGFERCSLGVTINIITYPTDLKSDHRVKSHRVKASETVKISFQIRLEYLSFFWGVSLSFWDTPILSYMTFFSFLQTAFSVFFASRRIWRKSFGGAWKENSQCQSESRRFGYLGGPASSVTVETSDFWTCCLLLWMKILSFFVIF